MVRHTTSKQLFRHASDAQCCDCGRACAQMIISALTQGVPAGTQPTPAERAQAVPITQQTLQGSEADPVDGTGKWSTFPDEMLELLRSDARLIALGLTDWRLANCTTPEEIFAWAAKSIRAGMPAVLNIKEEDHWICLRAVQEDGGVLTLMECLDPLLPHESNPPGPGSHTYLDLCETDKNWALVKQPPGTLGSWEMTVGSTPPTTYQGRCVAIVYGPPPSSRDDLTSIQKRTRHYRIPKPWPPSPDDRARALLTNLAGEAGIQELSEILHAASSISVRIVHDIAGAEKPYAIAALHASALDRGVVAIFDEGVETLIQLRVTSSLRLTRSIAGSSADVPLWWQRRGVATLYSPFFPFARFDDSGQRKYRRLIDGHVLVL